MCKLQIKSFVILHENCAKTCCCFSSITFSYYQGNNLSRVQFPKVLIVQAEQAVGRYDLMISADISVMFLSLGYTLFCLNNFVISDMHYAFFPIS